MDGGSKNIIILVFQYSVVAKGMEKKLSEAGYNVSAFTPEEHAIRNYSPDGVMYMVYLPNDIAVDKGKLLVISDLYDRYMSKGAGIIYIGEQNFKDDFIRVFPKADGYPWVNRPIDMDSLPDTVEKAFSQSNQSAEKKKILIVDDDPSYATMVREWIKDDYQVYVVTAGMQAITFLLKKKADLILLDYEMPVVDGPQVLQMLRQEEETKNIPVIFLTGVGTREGVQRVMELKPDGYVLKSTTKDNLLSFLKEKLH